MQDFKKLLVWQKAHELVLGVYEASQTFPRNEMFGLTSQIRRSAVSIASNIAEGRGRNNDGDFRRSLQIALGSCAELEYQLVLARDLTYVTSETYAELETKLDEVRRMLISFVQKLEVSRSKLTA